MRTLPLLTSALLAALLSSSLFSSACLSTAPTTPVTALCLQCTPLSFYNENYECDATEDALANGETCMIIPGSTAFMLDSSTGCLQEVFMCPAGSFFSITLGTDPEQRGLPQTGFATLMSDIICDGTNGKDWVLQNQAGTANEVLTSFTCYNKVPCANCGAPPGTGASPANCPVGATCTPLVNPPTTEDDSNGCKQPKYDCTGFTTAAITLANGTVITETLADLETGGAGLGLDCQGTTWTITDTKKGVFNNAYTAVMCVNS